MSDVVIRAERLSKRYRIGERQKYKALRDTLTNALYAPLRMARSLFAASDNETEKETTIWALKDVSFEIKQGEVVGVIGHNGAGKSTLLKILSRITEPTEGYAEIHGRVGSLLDVGTGFHPELTGRENVYLNGAIIGMKKREIDRKFDEIVAFAEIEQFLDTTVKYYSTGMYMRLAFSVAAHLEPEILLVDEALAVGDTAFQKKCLGKMNDVAREGRTVLFVSHNLAMINTLCERVLWLDGGKLHMSGNSEQVVSSYITSGPNREGQCAWKDGWANPGVTSLNVQAVCIRNEQGQTTGKLEVGKPFSVEITYRLMEYLPFCRVGFVMRTVQGLTVFEAYDSDNERYAGPRKPGVFAIRCDVPGDLLNAGRYLLSINAGVPNVTNLAFMEDVLIFEIEDTRVVGTDMYIKREGIIRPTLQWASKVDKE
jgi:homopolymeric O-antigen transport system ATP-binding protein